MKKAYLIHGWGGTYTGGGGWIDYLRKKLPEKGYELFGFDMPNTEEPVIEEWLGLMKEKITGLDKDVYLIGHSVGCQAILRFLAQLEGEVKVGGCVFVAPWMHLDQATIEEEGEEVVEIAKPWIENPIDFDKVKKHCNNFLAIFSDNDPYVPLSNAELFKKKLGAETKVLNNKEHFNEVLEMPEIVDFIK